MKAPVEVVILPTENYTGIVLHSTGLDNILHTKESAENAVLNIGGQHQHVYAIVSQDVEPIKVWDWVYSVRGFVGRFGEFENSYVNECRKIIATDDPNLIYSPNWKGKEVTDCLAVPQVPQSFIKELVANPDGEWTVEYEKDIVKNKKQYEITNIPRVYYKLKINPDNTVNITLTEDKMYSKKELLTLKSDILHVCSWYQGREVDRCERIENWIKENL